MNVQTAKIQDGLYYLGANDRDTELFENMWPLPEGVSYNSYLIKEEKNVLLDTIRTNKADSFITGLQEILDGEKLDYLVIHHMEPDHSGAIGQILDYHPEIEIIGNTRTKSMLADYYEIEDVKFTEVKTGDTFDFGSRKLTFIQTPMVHWPESMVSYDAENKVLFSQDIFGGFGTVDGGIFDDEVDYEARREEYRRYYTNIVGKYSMMAEKALKEVGELEIDFICPVHGYVWRKHPERIIEDYVKWATKEVQEGVVIAYASMYGNTEYMADTLARFLAEEGVKNIEVRDVSKTHSSYILSNLWEKNCLILGSCTYNNSAFPNMNALVHLLEMQRLENQVYGVFGSYGWSGGAVEFLQEFGESTKMEMIETVANAKGTMKEEDLENLRQMAKEIAEKIK